ncbi:hypothetical protein E4S40_00295 [Algoriphagus kandeliae]|uniref:Uncharacterized protein n=1 Tax=Algoriphagus kandeliae TaxID=2562278 RepID=A0A4Y9QXG8_9BACT|nr:hypothetical protein [Algoriphagus kandeliae]TFV97131.1 hypothetical protein E4S40_00295 [Algoriphagus kandeliae]
MKKYLFKWILLLTSGFLLVSCTDGEDLEPDDQQQLTNDLNFPFTLSGDESSYVMEIDGVEVSNYAEILNTLNVDKSISVNFWGPSNDFNFGGFNWIPLGTGTYEAGHDLGPGNGTFGNNLFMVAFVKKDGVKYHAYSAHEYGFLEEERIPGSSATVKIITFEGKQTTYSFLNGTFSQFIGTVEGQFAGTFKTKDGKEVKVTKGQFRIVQKLPPGAVPVD